MESVVFIGMGSNLGDRLNNILRAKKLLQKNGIKIVKESRIYETEPVGYKNQEKFLNGVLEISTSLTARELLRTLQEIEQKLGRPTRRRGDDIHPDASSGQSVVPYGCRGERLCSPIRWGPRVIDLDILFYGDEIVSEDGLQIPHPEIPKRKFVLGPLAQIAPDFVHPILKKSVAELLKECPDNSEIKI